MKTAAVRRAEPRPAPAARPRDSHGDYRLEESVGHLLRRAHQRHTALFQQGVGKLQLTPTQFAALVKVRELGQVSQNQLGRLTAMDPATIQGVIQRLEARKLIERRPDPADRRCAILRLTASGQAILVEATGRGHGVIEATLAPLAAAERQAFLALLRKII